MRAVLEAVKMEAFYKRVLGINLADLQNMHWRDVVRRLITLHDSGVFRVTIQDKLTEHDVVSRIMRKDNYMVALINKGVLDIRLPWWFVTSFSYPSAGWELSEKTLFLTKSLEWSLDFCILQHMLNEHFNISSEFLRDVKGLQYRFVTVGIVHFLLLPFMLVFMIIHFFLENAQHFRSSQSYLGPRQWSPLALWVFREYNELPHVFEARINLSYAPANKYVSLFTNGYTATLAKFTAYISGSFVATLVLVSVMDEAILLYVRFSEHNLLWYLGVFSGVFAAAASFIPNESAASPSQTAGSGSIRRLTSTGAIEGEGTPAEAVMHQVAACTHHLPKHWLNRCHTLQVRDDFLELFPYKTKLFAMEVLSVLLTPLVLCFSLPRCVPDLLLFIRRHTVYVDGVGDICDYSTFDFDTYGNAEYMSPVVGHAASQAVASSARQVAYYGERDTYLNRNLDDMPRDGKLEQSYMSFRQEHPDWVSGKGAAQQSVRQASSMVGADSSAISFGRRPPVGSTPLSAIQRANTAVVLGRSIQIPIATAGDALVNRLQNFKMHQIEAEAEGISKSLLGRSIVHTGSGSELFASRRVPPSSPLVPAASSPPAAEYFLDEIAASPGNRPGIALPPLAPQNQKAHLGARPFDDRPHMESANDSEMFAGSPLVVPPTPLQVRREISQESAANTEVSNTYNSSSEDAHPSSDEQRSASRGSAGMNRRGAPGMEEAMLGRSDAEELHRHTAGDGSSSSSYMLDEGATVHHSLGSILRSALKGEQMEYYENDFYWLNKFRAEQVRQSASESVSYSVSSAGFHTPPLQAMGRSISRGSASGTPPLMSHSPNPAMAHPRGQSISAARGAPPHLFYGGVNPDDEETSASV